MPAWIDLADEIYGLPDFKGRGFKVAPDRHGLSPRGPLLAVEAVLEVDSGVDTECP